MTELAQPPAEITLTANNDTVIGDLGSYLRWDSERNTYQMYSRIEHNIVSEVWNDITKATYDRLHPEVGGKTLTVGSLARLYAFVSKDLSDTAIERNKMSGEAKSAIAIIGERLIQESNDRGWCDEFDSIIKEVNEALPDWLKLPERRREYCVSWTEEYIVTVSRSAVVTASSEEDAIDQVSDWEEADSYEITESVGYGNYTYSMDNNDYCVEEY